jgi:spermidine synthase
MAEGTLYFRDGELVAEHGTARVYRMNEELFLEIGPPGVHTLWALESELMDYMQQLESFPKGDCLEIGLGLGVASRYILTFPQVKHLTTVEANADVIALHEMLDESLRRRQLDYNKDRHRILHANGIEYAYQTNKRYDFIFIDCYDVIDEDTLPFIADMINACNRVLKHGGKMIGWLDPNTPEQFAIPFMQMF